MWLLALLWNEEIFSTCSLLIRTGARGQLSQHSDRLEDGIGLAVGAENVLHSTQAASAALQCSIALFQSLNGPGREADFLLASGDEK